MLGGGDTFVVFVSAGVRLSWGQRYAPARPSSARRPCSCARGAVPCIAAEQNACVREVTKDRQTGQDRQMKRRMEQNNTSTSTCGTIQRGPIGVGRHLPVPFEGDEVRAVEFEVLLHHKHLPGSVGGKGRGPLRNGDVTPDRRLLFGRLLVVDATAPSYAPRPRPTPPSQSTPHASPYGCPGACLLSHATPQAKRTSYSSPVPTTPQLPKPSGPPPAAAAVAPAPAPAVAFMADESLAAWCCASSAWKSFDASILGRPVPPALVAASRVAIPVRFGSAQSQNFERWHELRKRSFGQKRRSRGVGLDVLCPSNTLQTDGGPGRSKQNHVSTRGLLGRCHACTNNAPLGHHAMGGRRRCASRIHRCSAIPGVADASSALFDGD